MSDNMSQIDMQRYSRQIMLEDIGYEGQTKLANSTVTVVGAGGLGSPILQRLVTMGVKTVRVVDRDAIDVTNLHRQILFRDTDIGKPKVEVAVERLRAMNQNCDVRAMPASVNSFSAPEIVRNSDVVIDALDSVTARYALNEACIDQGVPFVTGGAVGVQGQVFTVLPDKTACYNCAFPGLDDDMIPSCGIEGVHPAILGIIGNIEVAEATAILVGKKPSLADKMLHVDIQTMTFTHTQMTRVPECPVCGTNRKRQTNDTNANLMIEELCGRDMGKRTFAVTPPEKIQLSEILSHIETGNIKSKSDMGATISWNGTMIQLMEGGSAIMVGSKDEEDAKKSYSEICKRVM